MYNHSLYAVAPKYYAKDRVVMDIEKIMSAIRKEAA